MTCTLPILTVMGCCAIRHEKLKIKPWCIWTSTFTCFFQLFDIANFSIWQQWLSYLGHGFSLLFQVTRVKIFSCRLLELLTYEPTRHQFNCLQLGLSLKLFLPIMRIIKWKEAIILDPHLQVDVELQNDIPRELSSISTNQSTF